MKPLQWILNHYWALTEDALETMLQIAQRDGLDPEALAARLGRPLDNTQKVTVRDGTAIVPVIGPLFRYANLFTEISGATSYELLARDFEQALASPDVQSIVLQIDSPGGEANGTHELAARIHAARGVKPIIAYVGGMAASAGYWLASAADRIIVDPTALLGSIGVRTAVVDTSAMEEKEGIKTYTIVSSQSPHKAIDPGQAADRARVQAVVDRLAAIFVANVARNRGVDEATVLNDFGRGDVLVGQAAVDAGMADGIGSLESLLADLNSSSPTAAGGGRSTTQEAIMTQPNQPAPAREPTPATYTQEDVELLEESAFEAGKEEGLAEGQQALIEKIKAICYSEAGKARPSTALKLALNLGMTTESALEILAAMPEEQSQSSFERHMAALGNPDVGPDGGEGEPEWQQAEARALEFVNRMAGGQS